MAATTVVAPASAGVRLRRILSYTEQVALALVLQALGDNHEGTLVASEIADANGITRSTVVSALRLAEAAGVLESRSLGMKGTWVRLIDRAGLEEAVRQ